MVGRFCFLQQILQKSLQRLRSGQPKNRGAQPYYQQKSKLKEGRKPQRHKDTKNFLIHAHQPKVEIKLEAPGKTTLTEGKATRLW